MDWRSQPSFAPDQMLQPPPNSVWRFTASHNEGSWSEQPILSNSIFPSLTQPAGGIDAYGNGIGYLLGGYKSRFMSLQTIQTQGYVPTSGITFYNTETGIWKNESANSYSTFGTALFGQMQFLPNVGDKGLLIAIGGSTSDVTEWTVKGSNYISFQSISIFDPATSTWYNQTATGMIPHARSRFCSVGAPGGNETHEIFIYSGHLSSSTAFDPPASNTDPHLKFAQV
jgi:hypothetical protein